MTIEVELPIRFWRIKDRLLGFKGETCEKCEGVIFASRMVCPHCSHVKTVEKKNDGEILSTTFGHISLVSEINKNGHQRESRDFVAEIDLDSGFTAKLLYSGKDLTIGTRVRIDDVIVNGGVQKVISIINSVREGLKNLTTSPVEEIQEVSRSSK